MHLLPPSRTFGHSPPLAAVAPNFALSLSVPKPIASKPLWALLLALLPPKIEGAEFYSPAEIAHVVGVGTPSVLHHCRFLFPRYEGQYRLSRAEAELVLVRLAAVGRKLPSRETILARLQEQEASQ